MRDGSGILFWGGGTEPQKRYSGQPGPVCRKRAVYSELAKRDMPKLKQNGFLEINCLPLQKN
jgi:hypothetical protein